MAKICRQRKVNKQKKTNGHFDEHNPLDPDYVNVARVRKESCDTVQGKCPSSHMRMNGTSQKVDGDNHHDMEYELDDISKTKLKEGSLPVTKASEWKIKGKDSNREYDYVFTNLGNGEPSNVPSTIPGACKAEGGKNFREGHNAVNNYLTAEMVVNSCCVDSEINGHLSKSSQATPGSNKPRNDVEVLLAENDIYDSEFVGHPGFRDKGLDGPDKSEPKLGEGVAGNDENVTLAENELYTTDERLCQRGALQETSYPGVTADNHGKESNYDYAYGNFARKGSKLQ